MHPQALFTVFGQEVNLYGIFIGVCIIACFIVYWIYTSKAKMDKDLQDFIFFVAVIAIVLGFLFAKLFQAFYIWLETGEFNFKEAGITVMGGLIGGAGMFLLAYFVGGNYYFTKSKKGIHIKEFGKILRIAPCCIAIAHSIGRISCLMAGCCHGAYLGQEYVVGGIWMKGTVNDLPRWGYYVPTQLYEALFLLALFVVLSIMFFKKSNIMMHVYLISYAVWRFIIEFFRADAARSGLPGLYPSQWMSIVFLLIGVGLLIWYKVAKIPFTLNDISENFVFCKKDMVLLENNLVVEDGLESVNQNAEGVLEIEKGEERKLNEENKVEEKENLPEKGNGEDKKS